MQPFKLKDPAVPGRRTIAAVFLVDPNTPIVSTSDIPPQQRAWHDAAAGLRTLFPDEVQDLLDAKRDEEEVFPVSLSKAKKLRMELMRERKHVRGEHERDWIDKKWDSEEEWMD